MNECTEGNHSCDINAICTDTAELYNCTCKEGYSGDGKHCNGKSYNISCRSLLC